MAKGEQTTRLAERSLRAGALVGTGRSGRLVAARSLSAEQVRAQKFFAAGQECHRSPRRVFSVVLTPLQRTRESRPFQVSAGVFFPLSLDVRGLWDTANTSPFRPKSVCKCAAPSRRVSPASPAPRVSRCSQPAGFSGFSDGERFAFRCRTIIKHFLTLCIAGQLVVPLVQPSAQQRENALLVP